MVCQYCNKEIKLDNVPLDSIDSEGIIMTKETNDKIVHIKCAREKGIDISFFDKVLK